VIDGQQPLKLSKSIENFESDFSNGYLFGEILTQYNICESIVTFSKKTNKEAKVHNFYQIEDSLRYLKVPFDAKLSHQIMNEERGASLRLLYQLKLALDKHFAKGDLSVTNLKKTKVASL
jgi:negative regulator of genetic competence, sporulation and motility